MKISDILARKGSTVWKIAPECSVQKAIRMLCGHRVGALVVEGRYGSLMGLVTERDILVDCGFQCGQRAECAHFFAAACPRQVQEIMTTDVVTATPEDELGHVMHAMTRHRVRHLPVLDGGELVGIVSIGDLVHAYLNQAALESRLLESYVRNRPL